MTRPSQNREGPAFALTLAALVILGGCHTMRAVEQLPDDFWANASTLLGALFEDLWALIDLIL